MGAVNPRYAELASRVSELEAVISALREEVNRALAGEGTGSVSSPGWSGTAASSAAEALEDRVQGQLAKLARASHTLVREIGEQQQAGRARRESEQRLEALLKATDTVVLFLSPAGEILDLNPGAEILYGLRRAEALGQNYLDRCVSSEVRARVVREFRRVLRGQPLRVVEQEVIASDGLKHVLSWNADRVLDATGELAGLVAVGRDITEQRRAEQALSQSEHRYAGLFDRIRSGVAVYQAVDDGEDFVFVDFNPAGERIENVTRAELIGRRVTDVFPGVMEFGLLGVLRQVWRTGEPVSHPVTLYRDDHVVGWRENHVYRLPSGEVVAIYEDVTEQERAREERNRVFELSPDLLCVAGMDGYLKDVNPAWERTLGYSREELLSRPMGEFIHPDDHAKHNAEIRKLAAGEQTIGFENRYLHKKGAVRTVSWTATALTQERLIYGVGRDITERRRVEQDLLEARQEWEDIFQAIGQPAVILDPEHGIIAANDTVIRAAGKPRAEILGRKCWEIFHGPEPTGPPACCPLEQVRSSGQFETVEMEQEAFGGVFLVSCTPIQDDVGRLKKIIHIAVDVTESRRTERALRESSERLRLALQAAQMGTWEWDVLKNEVTWSPETERIFGLQPGDFGGTYEAYASFAAPDCLEEVNDYVRSFLETSEEAAEIKYEHRIVRADGREGWIEVRGTLFRDERGRPARMTGVCTDITDRKLAEEERTRLEVQLRQAQKMEAVGQLAGGVAHDFNNILTAILGNVELATAVAPSATSAGLTKILDQIAQSARRAATLTRQLLAFSRRQVAQPVVLDLGESLGELEDMLRRLLTENIALDIVRAPKLGLIRADPGQIEQIVMNLVVNARDAMPDGGQLTIETGEVVLDEFYAAARVDVRPGPHVVLAVSDTGCGMNAETLDRIYEPFFTTKELGQGTGLGLATVYGIVKQSGGHISVYSEPGAGTTFRVYWPALPRIAARPQPSIEPSRPATGTETVLICEDDDAVRDLAAQMAKKAGYTVLAACNGADALRLAARQASPLDLLVTDVVMPDMDGKRLAARLHETWPELKVLFVSGYTANVIAHHGVLDAGVEFLEKPFSQRTLLRRIREVLDGSP